MAIRQGQFVDGRQKKAHYVRYAPNSDRLRVSLRIVAKCQSCLNAPQQNAGRVARAGRLAAVSDIASPRYDCCAIVTNGASMTRSSLSSDLLGWHYSERAADAEHPVCATHHFWSVRHADSSHLQQPELRIDLALLFDIEMRCAFIQK